MKNILISLFIFFIFFSCQQNKNADKYTIGATANQQKKGDSIIIKMIKENKSKIKDGDLIERTDDDFVSETLREMCQKDKTFSHCGLAFIEDGQLVIYNSMAGDENDTEAMKRDLYDTFVSPHQKIGFGIFRYNFTPTELEQLHNIVKTNFEKKLPFDKAFDLKSNDKMYCAEMIYKSVIQATNNRIKMSTSKKQNFTSKNPNYKGMLIKEFEYIGLDDLFNDPNCIEITRLNYKH
jgi:Permuted papain-like amidase enzyme, YaeF/YiiX, C92 family